MLESFQESITIETRQQGLVDITSRISPIVSQSGLSQGVCTVFVQHTSCSLVIQENADPTARADLENWLARLAPENDPRYTHTLEGPDDMPAHLKAAVTKTSEQVPVVQGKLGLGTWQGLYLWEHRRQGGQRRVVITILGGRA